MYPKSHFLNRFCIVLTLIGIAACSQNTTHSTPETGTAFISKMADSAEHYTQQGNVGLAIQYHKRALSYAQAKQNKKSQAHALLQIANLLPRKDADTSLRYLRSALKIARDIKHFELQTNIYRSIAEIHKQQHDYNSAIYALEAQNLLTDSLLEERRIKDIRQLTADRNASEERNFAIATVGFLLVIAFLLAFFFFRTNRLNSKLAQSIAVKDRLFSIISHDLRGPAGNLRKALELVDSGDIAADELPMLLGMLKKQSVILNETLDSLLMWSKTQLDEIKTTPEEFNIEESISKTLMLLEGQSVEKNLLIDMQILASPIVYMDKNQFEFIIRNMLSNAIKFSHNGGKIRLIVKSDSKHIEVQIKDQGIGISPLRQKQFMTGTLRSTDGTVGEKGTGLGLRMVLDFMRYLGGKIYLDSGAGGTTFRLVFSRTKRI